MPPLLDSQQNVLREKIDGAGMRVRDFQIVNRDTPCLIYQLNPSWKFEFHGEARSLLVKYCPGLDSHETTDGQFTFDQACEHVIYWLENIERELHEQGAYGADEEPDWFRAEMPQQYRERIAEISRLSEEVERMGRLGRLLWQSGQPLNEAVRDVFSVLGYAAELTPRATTYDVTVDLDPKRRLLLEVTGIEGAIQKKSPKIGQVLQTTHEFATDDDRVVLAANTFRLMPIADRAKQESVTPDALKLIAKLGANFVTTHTLFRLWTLSADDHDAARREVERLHSQDGGVFKL